MSQTTPPPWQAHSASDYDIKMRSRCGILLDEIMLSGTRRQSILADPRGVHRELFADFTPTGYEEYAGTYRGEPGTTLEGRIAFSNSQLGQDGYRFVSAGDVAKHMQDLRANITSALATRGTHADNLLRAAMVFGYFGTIHPFLDGNGHVQRAIFAAMITEFGYPLNSRFALHPRPFDALLAIALELFARRGQKQAEGALIAEYLGYWVDGPFANAGGTLAPSDLY
ncbi:fido (protein-threonine AMPylation protein) [Peteryoungia aggregata LMG 23059]|uniref:Fido (Protein-threonine AMPylation protein) n=1 Tax=Peteryoungia aggregata LMG 23059 TaxID=1368425 RepID=A0ABU0G8C0_9HYPH|nr:Fic family protein [Peteryoungia aggregata]MDQ0420925.1 fido (protein-threonine AMPylation protein) [Peteryoungia aggregata LMG 23059]